MHIRIGCKHSEYHCPYTKGYEQNSDKYDTKMACCSRHVCDDRIYSFFIFSLYICRYVKRNYFEALIYYVLKSIFNHFIEGHRYAYPWATFLLFHMNFTQILHTISISLTVTLAVWRYVAIKWVIFVCLNLSLSCDNRKSKTKKTKIKNSCFIIHLRLISSYIPNKRITLRGSVRLDK